MTNVIVQLLRREDEGYPRVSNAVLLAFCGYVIIWYLQIGYRIPFLGAIRIEFIWALVLTAVALMSSNGPKLMDNPLRWVVILLFLAMAIQVPLSHVPQYSWNVFIDRVIKFAFMAFFIVSFVRSPKGLILFVGAFMLACMKMGQEGLIGQLTGNLVWQNQGIMRLNGSTPLYAHPNSFSGMALGTLPFILYLFPIAPRIIKIILAVQFIFACNIVLHTGSRAGYIAFFIMLAFAVFNSQNKGKSLLVLFLVSVVALPFIDGQYIDRFNTISTGQEIEGYSMGARKEILEDAIYVFKNHPFGIGVSAFPAVREKYFGRSQDTHNLYLEVGTNLGIQGLVIFIVFIYFTLRTLLFSIKSFKNQLKKLDEVIDIKIISNMIYRRHYRDLIVLRACTKSVVLFLIVRLSLGLFGMDLYEIYWWFALGIAIAIFNIEKQTKIKSDKILDGFSGNMKVSNRLLKN